jgi:hypothetical protein
MESMKKIVTNWSSMNAKTMSIDGLIGICIPEEYWLDGEFDKYRSFFRKKELGTLFYVRTGF